MKKVMLVVVILVLLTGVVWANSIRKSAYITLNSSTYTKLTNTLGDMTGFLVWVEDCTGFYYAQDSSGTGETYVDPDVACGLSFPGYSAKGETVNWFKAVSGTPKLYFQPAK